MDLLPAQQLGVKLSGLLGHGSPSVRRRSGQLTAQYVICVSHRADASTMLRGVYDEYSGFAKPSAGDSRWGGNTPPRIIVAANARLDVPRLPGDHNLSCRRRRCRLNPKQIDATWKQAPPWPRPLIHRQPMAPSLLFRIRSPGSRRSDHDVFHTRRGV